MYNARSEMKPAIVQKIIQAKESGNPKTSGVAELKRAYPGQMMKSAISEMTMQNQKRPFFRMDFLEPVGSFFDCIRKYNAKPSIHKSFW